MSVVATCCTCRLRRSNKKPSARVRATVVAVLTAHRRRTGRVPARQVAPNIVARRRRTGRVALPLRAR